MCVPFASFTQDNIVGWSYADQQLQAHPVHCTLGGLPFISLISSCVNAVVSAFYCGLSWSHYPTPHTCGATVAAKFKFKAYYLHVWWWMGRQVNFFFYYSDVNDYVLKVAGRESYIHGNIELCQFSQIIKMLSKNKGIELALCKKLDLSLDKPKDVPDVSLLVCVDF